MHSLSLRIKPLWYLRHLTKVQGSIKVIKKKKTETLPPHVCVFFKKYMAKFVLCPSLTLHGSPNQPDNLTVPVNWLGQVRRAESGKKRCSDFYQAECSERPAPEPRVKMSASAMMSSQWQALTGAMKGALMFLLAQQVWSRHKEHSQRNSLTWNLIRPHSEKLHSTGFHCLRKEWQTNADSLYFTKESPELGVEEGGKRET